MDTFLTTAFVLSVLALVRAFAAAIWAERKVAQHLRTFHACLWAEIAPMPGAEPSLSAPLSRFISKRRYVALGDPQLTRLGERARTRLYAAISVFLLVVLSGLGSSLLKG